MKQINNSQNCPESCRNMAELIQALPASASSNPRYSNIHKAKISCHGACWEAQRKRKSTNNQIKPCTYQPSNSNSTEADSKVIKSTTLMRFFGFFLFFFFLSLVSRHRIAQRLGTRRGRDHFNSYFPPQILTWAHGKDRMEINAGVGFCLVISIADDTRTRFSSFLMWLPHLTIVMFKKHFLRKWEDMHFILLSVLPAFI